MALSPALRHSLDRMPVGRQLYGAFFALLILTGIVGAVALVGLAGVESQAMQLSEKWLRGVGHLSAARAALVETRDYEVKHSRTEDKSYHAEYEDKAAEAAKAVSKALADYATLVAGDDERALNDKLAKAWTSYQDAQKKVLALGRDGKRQDAADISDGMASMAFDEALGGLNKLTELNFKGGEAAALSVAGVYRQSRLLVGGLLVAALVVGLGLAAVITSHLKRQLGGEPHVAVEVAQAVAHGDLRTRIPLRPGDDRSLMASLHAMQNGLAAAVHDVRESSERVAASSELIERGNVDLSSRTEEQAAALRQTAATMDQLSSTVTTNADSARQANALAEGASSVAIKGGEVVGQVVQTMRGINDSSKKIADIIAVIDGIAFQTNILALNAAVEAARAGEQGRGFAVVAAEVRSLAQRSAEAAKEIKGLITASVERVDHGTSLVDQAGRTMDEIVGAIKRVTDIVAEISAASVEQSAGVAQAGQAISQMDQATQRNAALVEDSSAAVASLMAQSKHLVQAVSVFRLEGETAVTPVVPVSSVTPLTPVTPVVRPAVAAKPTPAPHFTERRGPNRATNVARLPAPAPQPAAPVADAPSRTGTDDWETF